VPRLRRKSLGSDRSVQGRVGVVGVCALLTACVAPARSFGAFEGKAAATADSVLSQARTAILTAQIVERDGLFGPLVSIELSEAEAGARSAADAFASIQPPDSASDRLRAELLPLVAEAADRIASMRIAARRSDLHALAELADPLVTLADRLERFLDRHT
jgi:hypothetical protein